MTLDHGVILYGQEHVCTGQHVWGEPHDGFIMCELCYVVLPVTDVPKWEQRTRQREAVERRIDELQRELRQVQKAIYPNSNERMRFIRWQLDYHYGLLQEWMDK